MKPIADDPLWGWSRRNLGIYMSSDVSEIASRLQHYVLERTELAMRMPFRFAVRNKVERA